jgi:hypothetical protein
MAVRSLSAFFLLALLEAVLPAQTSSRAAPGGRQELVITNQNMGVVLESRTVSLPAGTTELFWDRAPASARTETWTVTDSREAGVRWLGLTAPLPGQGASETEWLAGLVGRRVRIERPGGSRAEGEILAVHGPTPAQVLFREGNDLVYGEPDARLSVPAAGMGDRPAGVVLKLESNRAGSRTLTSRYLVSDVGWEASYALTLAPDEKRGRLEGSFIVDNRTGTDFTPARLRLLAGTLRAEQPPMPKMMAERAEMMATDVVAQSTELSESRVYEVATPPRLAAGRTTFPLATDADVAVEKRYVARSTYWMGAMEEPQRIPVGVQYRLQTKALARALPAGVVRVYVEGGAVFTGEDRIEHTPERTDVEIETSETFDLTARRRQVSFTQTSRTESESAYEVVITSRKKEAVTILVREQFPGDWTVVESSVPTKKLGAFTAEFAVSVPAGGEAKLTYRVKVRMRG